MNETAAISLWENQSININLTTLVRLLEHGSDPLALYTFYCLTAKRQLLKNLTFNTSVYATDEYCMTGLQWGEFKFRKAKAVLKKMELITQEKRYSEKRSIIGYYVKVNYLLKGELENPVPEKPSPWKTQSLGNQGTNTNNKNLNTNNKKRNTSTSPFIETFNKCFGTKYQLTTGRQRHLKARLETFSEEDILEAIENISKDPFYQGKNDRGWVASPDYLFRSDENIDKALNMTPKGQKKVSTKPRLRDLL